MKKFYTVPDDIFTDVDIDMADGFDTLCVNVGRSLGKTRKQKLAIIERNKRLMKEGKIK